MKYGLKPHSIQAIKHCFSAHPAVDQAILYGSRAKGNYQPGSDIDITLRGQLTLADLLQLENALDDLLLPYTIDLSVYHQIRNQALLDHIQRIGIIFYRKGIDSENDTPSDTSEDSQTRNLLT